jgi:hypothetical protein
VDDTEHEDDPRRDEDAFHDASSDEGDGKDFVLSPHDRIEHDGGSDIRDDEQELEEGSQVDPVVLAATGDVSAGSSRTVWKRARAAMEVTNVSKKSAPKMRAIL